MEILKRRSLWICLLVLVLAGIYSASLHYPFLNRWDDNSYVTCNERLALNWDNVSFYFRNAKDALYTPATMLSLMLDRELFGMNPFAYRTHNLLLFMAATVFFFLLVRELGTRNPIAFLSALLWALNPQKVESVVWISERKDVLAAAFAIASAWFFVRALRKDRPSVVATLLMVLAIFSKPSALMLPGALILIALFDRDASEPISFRRLARVLWLPVVAGALAVWKATDAVSIAPEFRLDVVLHNLIWYPLTAMFPYATNPAYPSVSGYFQDAAMYVGGVLFFITLFLAARRFGVRNEKIFGACLITLCAMIPVMGLQSVSFFDYCDRYNLLVSAAVWAALGLLLERVALGMRRVRGGMYTILVCCCVFYALRTIQTIPVWASEYRIARHSFQKSNRPNFKIMELTLQEALFRKDFSLLADVCDKLDHNEEFYKKQFFKYMLLWENWPCDPASEPIDSSVRALRAHLALYRTPPLRNIAKAYWDVLLRNQASSVAQPIFCGNVILPCLLDDLIRSAAEEPENPALRRHVADVLSHLADSDMKRHFERRAAELPR